MDTSIIALIILAISIFFFVTNLLPAPLVGVGSCFFMVLFKVCSFNEAFSGFSDSIVILMASSMVIGIAMFETGVAKLVGRTVIKFSHNDEKLFLMLSMTVAGIMAMFLANTAILASFIPIINSVCKTSNKMKFKNLLLPIACAVMYGGQCTLIGCTPQLTANALLSKMVGIEMGMWTLTPIGIVLFVVFLLYIYFFGYERGKKIWADSMDDDIELENDYAYVLQKKYDKKNIVIMFIICVIMLFLYISNIIPIAMTALFSAMLCILFKLITVEDVVKKLRWDTVVFLASCLGIANALTVSKVGNLMGEYMAIILRGYNNQIVILTLLVILTLFISQFVTNSTAIIITLPIAFSLCDTYNFNHLMFTIGITYAASIACLTPLAAAQITMTQVARYKFSDYFRYSIVFTLISTFFIVLLLSLLYK